jgi:hypothetical protein
MLHKFTTVSDEPQKTTDILAVLWNWLVSHLGYFLWVRGDAIRVDHMTQVVNLLLTERTLAQFHLPLVTAEQVEYHRQVFDVLWQCLAVYKYIVKEDDDTSAEEWLQGFIHGAQEGGWGASEAERHDFVFLVSCVRLEGSLILLSWCQSDLVVASAEIHFGEPGGAGELVQQLVDDWHRILAYHRHRIESAIIHVQAPGAIFLLDQNGRRGEVAGASLNHPRLEQLCHLALDF